MCAQSVGRMESMQDAFTVGSGTTIIAIVELLALGNWDGKNWDISTIRAATRQIERGDVAHSTMFMMLWMSPQLKMMIRSRIVIADGMLSCAHIHS
jgi:hypothetical protein